MCKRNGDSTDHLLVHCDKAKALWDEIFVRLDIAWVIPKREWWIFWLLGAGYMEIVK